MFNRKKKNNKGFTLVELLVVIAIIGILAVVAVPSLMKNIDKSKAVQVTSNINAIKTEILSEYADGKTYDEIIAASTTIVGIVPANEIKAGESYSIEENKTKGVDIVVTTTAASDVLGRVKAQFIKDATDDAVTEVKINVAN